ncbi:hypothetical protein KEM55_007578 [Ascosphaera atra]|nr:hypothetical protein KEM55_007578 [Ascosphaera atra]
MARLAKFRGDAGGKKPMAPSMTDHAQNPCAHSVGNLFFIVFRSNCGPDIFIRGVFNYLPELLARYICLFSITNPVLRIYLFLRNILVPPGQQRPTPLTATSSGNTRLPLTEPLPAKIQRVFENLKELNPIYYVSSSPLRASKLRAYLLKEQKELLAFPFQQADPQSKVEYILIDKYLERAQRQVDLDLKLDRRPETLLQPFTKTITSVLENRAFGAPMTAQNAAQNLSTISSQVRLRICDVGKKGLGRDIAMADAYRAAKTVDKYKGYVAEWFIYFNAYDPLLTWWVASPYHELDSDLNRLTSCICHVLVGIKSGQNEGEAIAREPIGREALLAELRADMIAYTPEEILAIGEQEFDWCITEMKKASQEIGCGDNRTDALEIVRNDYVEPGKQTELVRELAKEGTEFVESMIWSPFLT